MLGCPLDGELAHYHPTFQHPYHSLLVVLEPAKSQLRAHIYLFLELDDWIIEGLYSLLDINSFAFEFVDSLFCMLLTQSANY